MKSFRKVSLKRAKLNKIHSEIARKAKKTAIETLRELDLDDSLKAILEKAMPSMQKIAKGNFPDPLKSALISEVLLNTPNDTIGARSYPSEPKISPIQKSILKHRAASTPKPSSSKAELTFGEIPKPSSSYAALSSGQLLEQTFQHSGNKNSFLNEIAHLYNRDREVLLPDGEPVPYNNIDRVVSWAEKTRPLNTRGPVGVHPLVDDIAKKSLYLANAMRHVKNVHLKKLLDRQVERIEKKRKKESKKASKRRKLTSQQGLGWQTLGIRY